MYSSWLVLPGHIVSVDTHIETFHQLYSLLQKQRALQYNTYILRMCWLLLCYATSKTYCIISQHLQQLYLSSCIQREGRARAKINWERMRRHAVTFEQLSSVPWYQSRKSEATLTLANPLSSAFQSFLTSGAVHGGAARYGQGRRAEGRGPTLLTRFWSEP